MVEVIMEIIKKKASCPEIKQRQYMTVLNFNLNIMSYDSFNKLEREQQILLFAWYPQVCLEGTVRKSYTPSQPNM